MCEIPVAEIFHSHKRERLGFRVHMLQSEGADKGLAVGPDGDRRKAGVVAKMGSLSARVIITAYEPRSARKILRRVRGQPAAVDVPTGSVDEVGGKHLTRGVAGW